MPGATRGYKEGAHPFLLEQVKTKDGAVAAVYEAIRLHHCDEVLRKAFEASDAVITRNLSVLRDGFNLIVVIL